MLLMESYTCFTRLALPMDLRAQTPHSSIKPPKDSTAEAPDPASAAPVAPDRDDAPDDRDDNNTDKN